MKKRVAILIAPLLLVACGDQVTEPTSLAPTGDPALAATAAGAPAGVGNCVVHKLRELVRGRVTPGSCTLIESTGARGLRYELHTPASDQMTVLSLTSQFNGQYGVKEATDDPTGGIFWGALGVPAGESRAFAFIGSSATNHVYVRGSDASQLGAFELGVSVQPVSWQCGRAMLLEAPASFAMGLDADHACLRTIIVSPFPEAIGQPILNQIYNVRLEAGRTYSIRIEGLTASFNPALTLWAGFDFIDQSVGPVPADGVRELVFTPTVSRLYHPEVASGSGDGMGGWITPPGSYTMIIAEM